MLMVFFSGVNLIRVNALLSGAWFTQEHFVNNIPPDIVEARTRNFCRVRRRAFLVDIDNSVYHNGRKVTDEFANLKLDDVPNPPYSPDLSPYDFFYFECWNRKSRIGCFRRSKKSWPLFIGYGTSWSCKTCRPSSSIELNDLNE
jgi:hypothetical protein